MNDVGLKALDVIHRTLVIDEPWTIRSERAFSWIGYRLAARVEASPLFMSLDIPLSRVTTMIEVVEDVGASAAEVEALLRTLNQLAIGAAYVFSPLDRTITAMCAHNVHEETVKWRPAELASDHITALVLAERHAEVLAERVKGRVARRTHPRSGERLAADEMLNVLEEHYIPPGAEASHFGTEAEMTSVYGMVRDTYDFSAGASADGIAIEVAFGEDETTLIELKTKEPHPLVGHGLGVFMTVRVAPDLPKCCHLANKVNRRQFTPGETIAALGAWTVRTVGEQHYLARSRFIPNVNYAPGRAVDCAQSAIGQAIWVDQLFHPNLTRRSSLPNIAKRLRKESPSVRGHS